MKRLLTIGLIWLVSVSSFAQQAKLVEEVTASSPDQLVIPYKKYVLPNGLTVLIHEDHSDPVVHVDVTYHVGSAREQVGRSGFAHFFEHMMFQGSDNVADEEHFKIVTESGGTLNGTTNLDRTNYFETMPSNQLETALWLEADRMGFFLDAVTQKKFEIQRATVKNERGQNYDNRPYGLAFEKVIEVLYPFGHPYSWSTIGYIEDLNAATLDDLKRFFLRWYGPNNATLTIAGDVVPSETIKLVEKYFGSIPAGPSVTNMEPNVPKLTANKYVSYEDNIRFPMLRIVIPTVQRNHPDEAPLDVLANILGGGNNSLMYQNFVKSQKAIQASASSPTSELSGDINFTILAYPNTTLADMEQLWKQTIEEFEKRGVKDEDLTRYKAQYESGEIRSLQSVSGKASKLAFYQTFTGNPNYFSKDLERYKRVTKEDVLRVFNQYVKGKSGVFLSIVPKGQSQLVARPDNASRPPVPSDYVANLAEYANLTYVKGKDNFDRSKRPQAGASPSITVPAFWTQDHANGIKMIGTSYTELPLVSFRIRMKGGVIGTSTEKAGLAALVASMLDESTEKYSAEEIALQLEMLGSSIDVYAGTDYIEVDVFSLTKNLDQTLVLLQEKLFRPKFDQSDFDRLKKQQLESIANQKSQASVLANNAMFKLLYPETSILSIPYVGTTESVEKLTLDDVKAYYKQFISPAQAQVIVVGNITKKEFVNKTEFLKTWTGANTPTPAFVAAKQQPQTMIYVVDKPGAPQSEIRVAFPGLKFDATGDYYKAQIMNYVLGGAFNSRLNLNLREDKGYTYGVRSGFTGSNHLGYFSVSGGFLGTATDSSVIEIVKELTKYRMNGPTQEELVFTINSIGQRDALKYETTFQKAGFLSQILEYNLDKNFVTQQNEILKNLRTFDMAQLSKSLLQTDNMAIIVVGDKAKIMDGLKKLGYPIVELE